MMIPAGTYTIGPDQGTLSVSTGTTGSASRTGHDLVIEVASWTAELLIGADPADSAVHLTADPASLRVLAGTGGLRPLTEDDKRSINQRIAEDVLAGGAIEFDSARVEPSADGESLRVHGELELHGTRRPVAFELQRSDDGRLTASAALTQSDFGIKPYSTMLGALKVRDAVQVTLAARPARA